ncbi:kinase-like protein [Obba rivulosa]|uniref:Kinase-like protein n=1 Tax=Obba rivulosa TaxID=1052685 RepID=A0A8E2AN42_9APHY|nr:kinase-like protein [Obba rivulosa]
MFSFNLRVFITSLFAPTPDEDVANSSSDSPIADRLPSLAQSRSRTALEFIQSCVLRCLLLQSFETTRIGYLRKDAVEDRLASSTYGSFTQVVGNVGLYATGRLWPIPCAILHMLLFCPDFQLSPIRFGPTDPSFWASAAYKCSSSATSPSSSIRSVSSTATRAFSPALSAWDDDIDSVKFQPNGWESGSRPDVVVFALDVLEVKETFLSRRELKHVERHSPVLAPAESIVLWSPFGDGYLVQCVLGDGSQGRVLLVEEAQSHEYYALKVVPKRLQYSWPTGRAEVLVEMDCMKLALEKELPFVMPLIRSWDDEEYVYFVMPFCPQTLHHRLVKGPINPEEARRIAAELILALRDLHRLRIAHRDIKPENIFITPNGRILLGDLGFAYQGPQDEQTSFYEHLIITDILGTAGYFAPEVIDMDHPTGEYTCKADLYSAGLVLFQVFTGRVTPYYDGEDMGAQWDQIVADPYGWAQDVQDELQFDFLYHMLALEPEERLTAEELLNHPYFTSAAPPADVAGVTSDFEQQSSSGFDWTVLCEHKCSGLEMPPFEGPRHDMEYRLSTEDAKFVATRDQQNCFDEQIYVDATLDASGQPSDFLYKCPPDREVNPHHGRFSSAWELPFTWREGRPVTTYASYL